MPASRQLHLPVRKDVAGETPVTWPRAEAAAPVDQTEIRSRGTSATR